MKKIYDTIFKFDTKGKVREWKMEQDGERYRTIAGLQDGQQVTSAWTQAEPTNVGRANHRNPTEQATFEIEAAYVKKLTREYHKTLDGAGGGAHFFKPMLAEKYVEFAPGFAQPKLDGIRCIAKIDGLWSRQGKSFVGAPHILETLKPLFDKDPSLILDGELYNHEFKDDFNSISSYVKKQKPTPEMLEASAKVMQYHVYDIPSSRDNFGKRIGTVFSLLTGSSIAGAVSQYAGIVPVPAYFIASAEIYDRYHGEWLQAGYEGSMWRADAPYEQKRSNTLRKRKEFQDDDFPISKIIEGVGNYAGCGKVVEYILPGDKRLENGERPKATLKGTQEFTRQVLVEAKEYVPGIVTVKFFAYTPDGIPRFPVAVKIYKGERDL